MYSNPKAGFLVFHRCWLPRTPVQVDQCLARFKGVVHPNLAGRKEVERLTSSKPSEHLTSAIRDLVHKISPVRRARAATVAGNITLKWMVAKFRG